MTTLLPDPRREDRSRQAGAQVVHVALTGHVLLGAWRPVLVRLAVGARGVAWQASFGERPPPAGAPLDFGLVAEAEPSAEPGWAAAAVALWGPRPQHDDGSALALGARGEIARIGAPGPAPWVDVVEHRRFDGRRVPARVVVSRRGSAETEQALLDLTVCELRRGGPA